MIQKRAFIKEVPSIQRQLQIALNNKKGHFHFSKSVYNTVSNNTNNTKEHIHYSNTQIPATVRNNTKQYKGHSHSNNTQLQARVTNKNKIFKRAE